MVLIDVFIISLLLLRFIMSRLRSEMVVTCAFDLCASKKTLCRFIDMMLQQSMVFAIII